MDENMLDDFDDDVDITEELADTSDLPTSVIITNVDRDIFVEENRKVFNYFSYSLIGYLDMYGHYRL